MKILLGLREWTDRLTSIADGRLDEFVMNCLNGPSQRDGYRECSPSLALLDPTRIGLSPFSFLWG